jgi:hypothetical protein
MSTHAEQKGKAYPPRPDLFCIKYLRWLIDSDTVNEVGPDAFALLVAVVIREDALRYQYAPNYFNPQICRESGIHSVPALIRARERAIESGLLHYEPAAKRKPGRYFVSGFPNDSLPKGSKCSNDSLPKAEGKRKESDQKALPSTPILIPNPIKRGSRTSFIPPTVDQVRAYVTENGLRVDPDQFVDHYESNGWKVGKNPMRDWQAAARKWGRSTLTQSSKPATAKQDPPKRAVPMASGKRRDLP